MGWTVYYRVGSEAPFSPADRASLDELASSVTARLPERCAPFSWAWEADHGVSFFRQVRPRPHMVGGFTKVHYARRPFRAFDNICSALRQLQQDRPEWEVLVYDDQQLVVPRYALDHTPVPEDDDAEQALLAEWAALRESGDHYELSRTAWGLAELGALDRALEVFDMVAEQCPEIAGSAFVEAAELVLEHSDEAVDPRALSRLKRAAVRGVRGPRMRRVFERALQIRPRKGSEAEEAFRDAANAFDHCFPEDDGP